MKIKLAEALLRRKELQQKVDQIKDLTKNDVIYEIRARRVAVTEGLEDLNAEFPKLSLSEVTSQYDYYARALRLIDAAIQQANWTSDVDVNENSMNDFKVKEA